MPLEIGPAAVEADGPPGHRAKRVADGRGQRDGHVGPAGGFDLVPEDRDVGPRERPRRDRSAVDHDELARRGQERVEEHEQEHGIEAVVPDGVGDGLGDRVHRRDSTPALS